MKKHVLHYFLFATLISIIFFNLNCSSGDSQKTTEEQQDSLFYLNHHDTVGYVGMVTCRSCHNDVYKTFIHTGMGQSFDTASQAKSTAKFTDHDLVYDKFSDLYYKPFWAQDQFKVMEFRLNGKDTVHKRIETVDYIIGSGQHTNSHLYEENGYVYQIPITWYTQKGQWDLPPGFEEGHNVRFSRPIGLECMSCHNAYPDFVEGSENRYTNVLQGIDCERCHGPGELHVKEKQEGIFVDIEYEIDRTIVNPSKLSWDLQIDLCQRCHLQGNAVLKPGKSFYDFKPGMRLSSVMDVYMPKYEGGEEQFIMASHAQRLQQSQCFIQSSETTNTITCITCHNPHVSVKSTRQQVFNQACQNCHQEPATVCQEDLSKRLEVQDNCSNCHMPKSGTIDIPHVTVTDHFIRVPVTDQQRDDLKTFIGIASINNPTSDPLTQAQAHIAYYDKFEGDEEVLRKAYDLLSEIKSTSDPKTWIQTSIYLSYVRGTYQSVIELASGYKPSDFQDAWTCYRIGQSWFNLSDISRAESWLIRASSLAPYNLDFKNQLGSAWVELKQHDKAIALFKEVLKLNPKYIKAYTNLGFVNFIKGNTSTANQFYNQALQLNPDDEQTLFNKAALLNYLGKATQAKALLERILELNPNNQQVQQVLSQLP